jgi:hypothetical protein
MRRNTPWTTQIGPNTTSLSTIQRKLIIAPMATKEIQIDENDKDAVMPTLQTITQQQADEVCRQVGADKQMLIHRIPGEVSREL